MEVDDTRVRYTLPFWWNRSLVLARWNPTGCIAGISVAWIPSQLACPRPIFLAFSAWSLWLYPVFVDFSFPHFLPKSRTHPHSEGITTHGSPGNGKVLTIFASGRRGLPYKKNRVCIPVSLIGWSAAFASLRSLAGFWVFYHGLTTR